MRRLIRQRERFESPLQRTAPGWIDSTGRVTLVRSDRFWETGDEGQAADGGDNMTVRARRSFVICIETGDYPASLERWKVYPTVPDAEAEERRLYRAKSPA